MISKHTKKNPWDSLFPPNLGCDPKIPLIHLLPGSYEPPHGENSSKYPPTNCPPHPASASRCRLQTAPGGFQGDSKLRRASQLWSLRSWSCQGLPKTPEIQRRIVFKGKVKEKMVDVFLKKTRADSEQIFFFQMDLVEVVEAVFVFPCGDQSPIKTTKFLERTGDCL